MNKLKVLDLNTASDELFEKWFEGKIDYNKFDFIRAGDQPIQKIIEYAKDADIILSDPFHMTDVPTEVVEAGKKLKLIQCYTIGFDDVDIKTARKMSIPVANNAGIASKPIAEYTIMAALYLTKSIKQANEQLLKGNWIQKQLSSPPEIPLELGSLTFGILGCGSIGQEIARHVKSFGSKIIYHNRNKLLDEIESELNLEYVTLSYLLSNSDILSINVPLTDETRGMIAANELESMKKGAVLINTSRGGVVNEQDLADVLKRGHLRGAAIDVFEDEPHLTGCPLREQDNVILTPHSSAISPEIITRAIKFTMENLHRIYDGLTPLRIVN
jgi:phosphoglycerate dehydrogenase-like enzyme